MTLPGQPQAPELGDPRNKSLLESPSAASSPTTAPRQERHLGLGCGVLLVVPGGLSLFYAAIGLSFVIRRGDSRSWLFFVVPLGLGAAMILGGIALRRHARSRRPMSDAELIKATREGQIRLMGLMACAALGLIGLSSAFASLLMLVVALRSSGTGPVLALPFTFALGGGLLYWGVSVARRSWRDERIVGGQRRRMW